jgi:hypothetical protein
MRKADGAPLLKAAQAPQCLREFSQVLDAASQVGAARATEQHAKQVTQKTENWFIGALLLPLRCAFSREPRFILKRSHSLFSSAVRSGAAFGGRPHLPA